jgi:hypothetical protein
VNFLPSLGVRRLLTFFSHFNLLLRNRLAKRTETEQIFSGEAGNANFKVFGLT